MTAEQKARDMLERMGVPGAQSMTAGDLVELANLIAERRPQLTMTVTADMGASLTSDGCTIYPGDVFHCYKVSPAPAPSEAPTAEPR